MRKREPRKSDPGEPKGFAGSVYMLCHDFLYVLAIITVVFVFFARLTGVHGSSMYPTLVGSREDEGMQGDFLVLESNVLNTEFKQGDIVVASLPTFENNKPIVKRVIATPGQTVNIQYDESVGYYRVFIDGMALEETYINGNMAETMYQTITFPALVPANCYFLMGDNRNNSNDSRNPSIGMVDRQYIVGKAQLLVVPGADQNNGGTRDWTRWGLLYKD